MATANAILYTRYQSKDGSYPIVIRLINGRKQKLHPVGHKVLERSFKDGYVVDKHPHADIINSVIDAELAKAKRYFSDCKIKGIPIDLELAFKDVKSHSFSGYLKRRAAQYSERDMIEMEFKTKKFYKDLLDCFGREVYFSDLTIDGVRTLEGYYLKAGNIPNTIYKKFEHLKKFYNAGIKEGLAHSQNPFADYKIKTTPVKKAKLTTEQIKLLEDVPLKPGMNDLARDMFLFSYYTKGQRFETCLTMKKEYIAKGRIAFQTNKGKKWISVLIHPRLQDIINKYIDNPTETIFGRNKKPLDELTKRQYRSFVGSENATINRSLKDVALLAGITMPLSMHMARGSLAYNLLKKGSAIEQIKDILGHSHYRTTEIYLKELDDTALDEQLAKIYD